MIYDEGEVMCERFFAAWKAWYAGHRLVKAVRSVALWWRRNTATCMCLTLCGLLLRLLRLRIPMQHPPPPPFLQPLLLPLSLLPLPLLPLLPLPLWPLPLLPLPLGPLRVPPLELLLLFPRPPRPRKQLDGLLQVPGARQETVNHPGGLLAESHLQQQDKARVHGRTATRPPLAH